MEIKLMPVDLSDIIGDLAQHLSSLASPVDTFFEGHIENANHYHILIDGAKAGYTSIHDGNMITQFFLADSFKKHGQPIFQVVKKIETVQRAFVPTCDGFFLAHALDEHKSLEKQAYFFQANKEDLVAEEADDYMFSLAEMSDVALIQQVSGDFFEPIKQRAEQGELFIANKEGQCVGFGIMVKSRFRPNTIDIGMYTDEKFRRTGVGSTIIRFLINECKNKRQQIVAGCWYYNHYSKKTLEKAGMYSQTRLLKIGY